MSTKPARASSSRTQSCHRRVIQASGIPHKGHTKIRAFLWIADIEYLRDLLEQGWTERGQREFASAFGGGIRDEKITEAYIFPMAFIVEAAVDRFAIIGTSRKKFIDNGTEHQSKKRKNATKRGRKRRDKGQKQRVSFRCR